MAYRFSDTAKWDDEWFIDLNPNQKLLFMYLCDNCDIAGFYELSTRKLRFDTGISESEIKASFKGLERGFILSIDKRVLFLKKFIKHQKNLPLNPNNKAHLGIFRRFDNYKNRFEIDLISIINKTSELNEIDVNLKGLTSPTGKGIGNYTTIKEYKGIDFLNFWNLYGKKVGNKKSVEKKWCELKIETQNKILQVLPEWKLQFRELDFQPYPETFLNQERWNDEIYHSSKPQIKIINGQKIKDESNNHDLFKV